ncbi:MAG: SMC-Scp complex subunit ScpB [Bryobacteraceae bacterium]
MMEPTEETAAELSTQVTEGGEPDAPPVQEPDAQPVPISDPPVDPEPDPRPEPDPEPELEADPEPDPESEADPEPEPTAQAELPAEETMSADDLIFDEQQPAVADDDASLKAVLEAVIYVSEEPLALGQIAGAIDRPVEKVKQVLDELIKEYERPERGLTIREVAGGYKMGTKPEHHEAVRAFVKALKPPLKLSLAALETLAVIAYKQPITSPEILEIRGVQGAGVLKTLLDRKLITTAGRKNVIGKPILYRTTKEFLLQFGLKDLSELPTLKEFEELRRLALTDAEEAAMDAPAQSNEGPQAEPVDEAALSAAAATMDKTPEPPVADAEPDKPAEEPEAPKE